MKRGQITLTELGYLLLALLVISAILMAVSRGCDLIQSNKEKAQAQGTLTQLVNFLDSMKENNQDTFIIYSPKEFYLASFTSPYQCSTNCICICEDKDCLSDNSYCKNIKKSITGIGKDGVQIGLQSLIVKNNVGNYDVTLVRFDDANDEVFTVTSNCSGPLVILTGSFQIRQSVKAAFDDAQKYAESLGQSLIVTSAYRSVESQNTLLSNLGSGNACIPKDTPNGFGMNCPHVLGCAIDVHLNSTKGLSKDTINKDTLLLRKIMEHAGFTGYSLNSDDFEFWHFNYGISTQKPVNSLIESHQYEYSK